MPDNKISTKFKKYTDDLKNLFDENGHNEEYRPLREYLFRMSHLE